MPTGRRLHLVDVENLVGGGHVTRAEVERCSDTYERLGVVEPGDLVVVGCNPHEVLAVGLGWRRPHRIVMAHGPDGADEALLRVIEAEEVHARFTELIVASGDGIFAGAVHWLRGLGMRVTVVAPPTAIARRLSFAADRALLAFPQPDRSQASREAGDLVQAA
jgi:hypothetical protein